MILSITQVLEIFKKTKSLLGKNGMYKNSFSSSTCKLDSLVKNSFILCVVISPLFLLTVSGWMTRIVVICALLAMVFSYKNNSKKYEITCNSKVTYYKRILFITLCSPILAILLGQLFRGQYEWPYYDSPAHILICIFILLAATKTSPYLVKWMSYSFPMANLFGLISILHNPNLFWGSARLSTHALDPLDFGSLSLTFALISLVSIKLHDNDSKWLIVYKLIGFVLGVYLSILSGSRTGWLAVPIIFVLWLYYDHVKIRLLTKIASTLIIIVMIFSSYFFSSNVHQRVNDTTKDLSSYQWNTSKPNDYTSVGARISFIRIAAYLFEKKPLSGWGDGNFGSVINDPALNFSLPETKKMALGAGFHNDITANMVRSGIWGLIATIALFLIPAIFFMQNLKSGFKKQSDVAFLALTFLTCQFMSSLTMEIFNLKYSASLYGLMIAIFCGQIIYDMSKQSNINNGEKK